MKCLQENGSLDIYQYVAQSPFLYILHKFSYMFDGFCIAKKIHISLLPILCQIPCSCIGPCPLQSWSGGVVASVVPLPSGTLGRSPVPFAAV